jgi:hypothetical protein
MDFATLVVTVLGFFVSAGPMLVQAIRLARGITKYDLLQKTLEKEKDRLTDLVSYDPDGWDRIITLLNSGDMIMPHVVARFWRRFGLLLAVALGTAGFAGKEFRWHQWSTRGDVASLVLVAGNWLLPWLSFLKTDLLDPEEKRFLRNFGILHDMFYKKFVVPLIGQFNARCRDALIDSEEIEKHNAELQRLLKNFVTEFRERQAQFKSLPAPPSVGLLPEHTGHDSHDGSDEGSEHPAK